MVRKKSLNLTRRPTRKLPRYQAYSRIYYEKKLKVIVDALWKRRIDKYPDLKTKGEALKHRNAVIKELFEDETDEVKAEVDRKREEGDFSEHEDINFNDAGTVDAVERRRRNRAFGVQRKVFFLPF